MHHFGQSKVMLIADENTWSAGGLAAQSELQKAGYEVEKHLFPANPQPRPTIETALVESWQDGVPEFRPRFAEWPEITEIVQEWGTKIMLNEVTTEEGAQILGERMEAVLDEAGYYSGSKPLAQ